MHTFELHERLAADCFFVGDLPLCRLLMMNDSRYPWYILAPRRAELKEIYQLAAEDQQQLTRESCLLAVAMQTLYQPDKLNIAAIGNLVPQLHLHHVARYQTDAAWPAPVWGKLAALPYAPVQAQAELQRISRQLCNHLQ